MVKFTQVAIDLHRCDLALCALVQVAAMDFCCLVTPKKAVLTQVCQKFDFFYYTILYLRTTEARRLIFLYMLESNRQAKLEKNQI